MDILMIGGTGTISYDATCYFLEKGHNVYLLNRGNRNDLSHEHLHYIIGNANNTENMKIALDGMHFDVVLDFIIYTKAQLANSLYSFHQLQYTLRQVKLLPKVVSLVMISGIIREKNWSAKTILEQIRIILNLFIR